MPSHEDSEFQANSSLYNEDSLAFHENDSESYLSGLDDKRDPESFNPFKEKVLDKIISVKSIRGHVQSYFIPTIQAQMGY